MSTGEVRDLLQQLQRAIGTAEVALECRCDNLETVYLSLTPSGEVLVSDQGRTFEYLGRGADATYKPVEELDMRVAAEACAQSGTTLRRDDPEAYPTIECMLAPAAPVAMVVGQVAEAVDRVFKFALRDELM